MSTAGATIEIDAVVAAAGTAWVAALRRGLASEGRAMQGGWPGTMTEARAWIEARVLPELAGRGLPRPSRDDIVRAAGTLNAHARNLWRREAVAEPT